MRGLIKTTIIEDNSYLRKGWQSIIDLEDDMCVIGCFESCEQALESNELPKSDIILMDIGLPGMSGIEGVKRIGKEYPDIHIVMASVFEDDENIFNALKAGAVGYLAKNMSPKELVEAIRDAKKGGSPITPNIARKVINVFHAKPEREENKLSEQEITILNELATGSSYAAIAEKIFLSVDGVRYHIRNIYKKLQVHSRSEAVAKGIRKRIIKPE